jgi:heterodisulfide reductase subunit A
LIIYSEDTNLGLPIELEAEMVVLATAAIPKKDSADLARILNLSRDANGFFMESHPKLKPMDAPTDGIFFAGTCQSLKDIPYCVAQGCGAAARAATVISKKTWKIEPIISVVDPAKCKSCGICVDKCPYGAIRWEKGQPASIITASCHGCGTCAAECPHHAITQMHFTDAQIKAQIRAALEKDPEDKILAFLCNWCSYAGADLAGISRFEYPASVRPIRVMCSGRVSNDLILEALRLGAGMVLVGACHLPYDCHYIDGNARMKERTDILKPMLQKLGLSPKRFRVEYISAAEGNRYADVITEIDTHRKTLGKAKIQAENAKLKPILENMLNRSADS